MEGSKKEEEEEEEEEEGMQADSHLAIERESGKVLIGRPKGRGGGGAGEAYSSSISEYPARATMNLSTMVRTRRGLDTK